ncbi:MAG: hypothetical protein ACE5JE_03145 [Thermoplasmata archaeon]
MRNGFLARPRYSGPPVAGPEERRIRGHRLYDYFMAFEDGLTDQQIADKFQVSVRTVERYRQLPRYYDLAGLEELVIGLRRRRAHLSTIFRNIREDPGFSPFDGLLLLLAICRVIKDDGRILSEREMRVALRSAFEPTVHDEEQLRRLLALVGP